MTIHELGPGSLGPKGPRRVRDREEASSRDATSGPSQSGRVDRVEISDEARALSSKGSLDGAAATVLTEERADEIRARIDSGAYDTPEVAEKLARLLIDSRAL